MGSDCSCFGSDNKDVVYPAADGATNPGFDIEEEQDENVLFYRDGEVVKRVPKPVMNGGSGTEPAVALVSKTPAQVDDDDFEAIPPGNTSKTH